MNKAKIIEPRLLSEEEQLALHERLQQLSDEEACELFIQAWEDVDMNAYCFVCKRKFKNRKGLAIHSYKAHGVAIDLAVHDFFLAKRLGIIKEAKE